DRMGGNNGFSGPGYGGIGGSMSQLVRAALMPNGGSAADLNNMRASYEQALAGKVNQEGLAAANANAANGSISDLFRQAGNAELHANDPVVTDLGPSNTGPLAQATLAGIPAQIAAASSYVSPQEAAVLPKTWQFVLANQGAGTSAAAPTSALARAVVGAGGNDAAVKGAILADQPPAAQALAVGPAETQEKAYLLSQAPKSIVDAALGGQAIYGQTASQAEAPAIAALSPADARTRAMGSAAMPYAPTPFTAGTNPDGSPITAIGAFNRATGTVTPVPAPGTAAVVPPNMPGASDAITGLPPAAAAGSATVPTPAANAPPANTPLAMAVTGPAASPDGNVLASGVAPNGQPATPVAAGPATPSPYMLAPPKGPQITPLSPDAIKYWGGMARRGQPIPLGFSPAYRGQIMEEAARQAAAAGDNADSDVAMRSGLKSDQMALTQLAKTRANIGQFEGTAQREAQLALSLAPKGVAGGVPVMNRWIQAGRTELAGNGDVSSFNAAVTSFKNEYARIMSSNGGTGGMTSDSARAEAEKLINQAQTLPQLQQVIGTMQKGMQNRIDSINSEYETTRQRIATAGQPQAAPAPAAPTVFRYDAQGNPIK
ncbi:MAG TPA: hypothetical protein VMU87_09385, partial [Stellaceae bacterium]|nr:hypothetical protein [Stellaceae bacterium]